MPAAKWRGALNLRLWLVLGAGLWLLAGCTLCTLHLYLYRDTPQKLPPDQAALLIANPALAQKAEPGVDLHLQGAQWAPEQPSYQKEYYRLSIDALDGQKVYQGRCLDTTAVEAVEVRPGNRQMAVRVDLLGPQGQEIFRQTAAVSLQAGKVYFVSPDWTELLNRRLALKVGPLPGAYTPEVRARLIDWRRRTDGTASLD